MFQILLKVIYFNQNIALGIAIFYNFMR